jgi:hypothetical protein
MDKKGAVYRTKDTPESVKIITTEWKQPVVEIRPEFGFSMVWAGGIYNCLSVDLIRAWRIDAGVEIGIEAAFNDWLIGISGKYRITDNVKILAGRDFYGGRFYAGVQFSF